MTTGTVTQVQKGKSLMDKNFWGGSPYFLNIVNLVEIQLVVELKNLQCYMNKIKRSNIDKYFIILRAEIIII